MEFRFEGAVLHPLAAIGSIAHALNATRHTPAAAPTARAEHGVLPPVQGTRAVPLRRQPHDRPQPRRRRRACPSCSRSKPFYHNLPRSHARHLEWQGGLRQRVQEDLHTLDDRFETEEKQGGRRACRRRGSSSMLSV